MIHSIKAWWKENVIALLFFGLIIFGLVSIVFSSTFSKGEATDLILFTDAALLDMDTRNETITNKTVLAKNTLDEFNSILNDLYSYSEDLEQYRSDIPRRNSSPEGRTLQDQLDLFFASSKISVDRIITEFTRQRDLRGQTFDYGNMQKIATEGGTKADLQKAYDGGQAIYDDLISQAIITIDEDTKERIQSRADVEKATLDGVLTVIEGLPGEDITQEAKDALATIYTAGWPTSSPSFPRIRIEEIETKEYAEQLISVQNSMRVVINKFDIKTDAV